MALAFFGFFAAIVIFSALAMAWQKNLLYASFLLLFALLGVAFLYLMLNAEFLAVTQILIYVGGVLTLFLFGILMTKRRENRYLTSRIRNQKTSIVVAVSLALILFYVVQKDQSLLGNGTQTESKTELIGFGLLSEYLIPFELVGVLLLVILIAVLVIATHPIVHDEYERKE
jgi:NADH:ubiquinone oxidoreductase subunit 6 (subunit J)